MKCREYIFLLTSDQLTHANYLKAIEAVAHRFICRQCRRFTRNDEMLLKLLAQQREFELFHLRSADKS